LRRFVSGSVLKIRDIDFIATRVWFSSGFSLIDVEKQARLPAVPLLSSYTAVVAKVSH
jgi:hypothetical protein